MNIEPELHLLKKKDFLYTILPLCIICGFIWQFEIEKEIQLPKLIPVVLGGFLLHAFIQPSLRLPFLFGLNILVVFLLFDPLHGGIILSISAGIFGLISLPLSFRVKALLLICVAIGLLSIKTFLKDWAYLQETIPYVGAVFMFRSILFLHESRYEKKPVPFWLQANYFFLLPNWILLIFPIVDYKTFYRNYYQRPAVEIYQKGLRWMALGAFHLFLYRLLYMYYMPSPAGIGTIFDLIQYLVVGYGLTLRLSGLFHLSVGIICLFGFDLPAAFANHFLASGFSDLWRRINIYWKDFVMKILYYPLYFRFKKLGPAKAIFYATMVVFAINWFLHAYQWQWITGSFLITIPDILFWGIFGILVALNGVIQQKKSRKKKKTTPFSFQKAAMYSLQVLGMFSFMCVFYSLWVFSSLTEWASLYWLSEVPTVGDFLLLLGLAFCLFLIGILMQYLHRFFQKKSFSYARRPFTLSLYGGLACLLLFSAAPVQDFFKETSSFDPKPILTAQLNRQDQELQLIGYYETLVSNRNFGSKIWNLETEKPEGWEKPASDMLRWRNGLLYGNDLDINNQTIFKNAEFSTNNLGLRDKDYSPQKPKNVLRIAMIGVSNDMGVGVKDNETYENLLEQKLLDWGKLGQVEILNFSLGQTDLIKRIKILEHKVLAFQPDVIFIPVHNVGQKILTLSNLLRNKYSDFQELPEIYSYLDSSIREIKIPDDAADRALLPTLLPYADDIANWAYQKFMAICKANDLPVVQFYLPFYNGINQSTTDEFALQPYEKDMYSLNLMSVFADYASEDITITSWDDHFNSFAHELIAAELFRQITADTTLLRIFEQARQSILPVPEHLSYLPRILANPNLSDLEKRLNIQLISWYKSMGVLLDTTQYKLLEELTATVLTSHQVHINEGGKKLMTKKKSQAILQEIRKRMHKFSLTLSQQRLLDTATRSRIRKQR